MRPHKNISKTAELWYFEFFFENWIKTSKTLENETSRWDFSGEEYLHKYLYEYFKYERKIWIAITYTKRVPWKKNKVKTSMCCSFEGCKKIHAEVHASQFVLEP